MQTYRHRPVRKVRVVGPVGGKAAGFVSGMFLVEAMYGPMRGEEYLVNADNLRPVVGSVAS